MGLEPVVRRAEELALREALGLGNNHVHSGHLLLSLLREPEHLAGALLLGHGVDRDVAAKAIRDTFRTEAVRGSHREADEARVLNRLDELSRELGRLRKVLQPDFPLNRQGPRGGEVSYLVSEHGHEVLLVVTRVVAGEVETATRRFDSQQEAVQALLEDAATRVPDAVVCLVNGQPRTLPELTASRKQPPPR